MLSKEFVKILVISGVSITGIILLLMSIRGGEFDAFSSLPNATASVYVLLWVAAGLLYRFGPQNLRRPMVVVFITLAIIGLLASAAWAVWWLQWVSLGK